MIDFFETFQCEQYKVSPVRFTCEFDAIVNTPSGAFTHTFYPNCVYFVTVDEGTLDTFSHIWLSDLKVVFDIPNHFFKTIS